MQRTTVICRDYLHYIRKYNHFEKHHKNMSVHLSPLLQGHPDRCTMVLKTGLKAVQVYAGYDHVNKHWDVL
eukprot:bmy_15130T0